jgi:Holliday junction resolvase-like predicted endonuclease
MSNEYTHTVKTIFNTCSDCEAVVINQVFGISDIETSPKTPCTVDTDTNNQCHWDITVNNPKQKTIIFNGIDYCINILRDNGEKDNICDACIRYDDTIIFIEIKNKRRSWLDQAANQISNTIKHFEKNNALSHYKTCKAYIANKHRPMSNVNHALVSNKMLQEHKCSLYISTKCTID